MVAEEDGTRWGPWTAIPMFEIKPDDIVPAKELEHGDKCGGKNEK